MAEIANFLEENLGLAASHLDNFMPIQGLEKLTTAFYRHRVLTYDQVELVAAFVYAHPKFIVQLFEELLNVT